MSGPNKVQDIGMTTYSDAIQYDVRQADLGKPYRVCLVDENGNTYFDSWWATIDDALAQEAQLRKQIKPEFVYRIAIFKCIPTS